jgi:transposase-like protein
VIACRDPVEATKATTRRTTRSSAESVNARYRRVVRARGHFPTEQAALMCLYLVTRSLDPTGKGRARWSMRWKPALNAFAIAFDGRIVPPSESHQHRLHR